MPPTVPHSNPALHGCVCPETLPGHPTAPKKKMAPKITKAQITKNSITWSPMRHTCCGRLVNGSYTSVKSSFTETSVDVHGLLLHRSVHATQHAHAFAPSESITRCSHAETVPMMAKPYNKPAKTKCHAPTSSLDAVATRIADAVTPPALNSLKK